jgi:hypothetical protein
MIKTFNPANHMAGFDDRSGDFVRLRDYESLEVELKAAKAALGRARGRITRLLKKVKVGT